MEITKEKLLVGIVQIPMSMLKFLKLYINIWQTFDNSQSNHMNARVCTGRWQIYLELAEGHVSWWASACPSKPSSFLSVPGISVIAQALLKSPIAYYELFQPSLILKTSTNQLKNMPGCISVPGTIITELKNSNLNFLLADPFFFIL